MGIALSIPARARLRQRSPWQIEVAKMIPNMKNCLKFSGVLCTLAAAACSSSFEGKKLSEDGGTSSTFSTALSKEYTGLPFTLTAPQYTLKIKPDPSNPARSLFALEAVFVPDPKQSYSLRVNPSVLANSEFSLSYGEHGNISNTSNKSTEQITPTLKALGSFVVNIAGVAGLGIFDSATMPQVIQSAIDNSGNAACAPRKTVLAKRLNRYIAGKPAAPSGIDLTKLFLSEFHYLDLKERKCLTVIRDEFQELDRAIFRRADEKWLKHRGELLKSTESEQDQHEQNKKFVAALDEAKKDISRNQAEGFVADLRALDGMLMSKTDDKIATAKARYKDKFGVEKPDVVSEELRKKWVSLVNLHYKNLTIPNKEATVSAVLNNIVSMPLPQWRARHVQYLDRMIADNTLKYLTTKPPSVVIANKIKELNRQVAVTIGAIEAYEKRLALIAKLKPVPDLAPPTARLSQYQDYERVRLEADRLAGIIATRKSNILAAVKPESKKVKEEDKVILAVTEDELKALQSGGKLNRVGYEERPDFVIYLRALDPEPVRKKPEEKR
jgi:hypothetical protein